MKATTRSPRPATDDTALAGRLGSRLKQARLSAGLTQQQLAGDRYTKAYVSALENGLVRPLDPQVRLAEKSRVIIVTTGQ